MSRDHEPFTIDKTFGLGVLLKLTKKNVSGIEISTQGDKFTANVPLDELNQAVSHTMEAHNIRLKLK